MNTMMKIILAAMLSASLETISAAEVTYVPSQSGTNDVTFLAIGRPKQLRVEGEGGKARGAFKLDPAKKTLSGSLTVSLADLTTGISMRDSHMKEKYLEVEKNPDAKLIIAETPFDLAQSVGHKITVPGVLELHGKSQPVSVALTLTKVDEKTFDSDSSFMVKLSEFAIAIPSFAGITIAEDAGLRKTSRYLTYKPFQSR